MWRINPRLEMRYPIYILTSSHIPVQFMSGSVRVWKSSVDSPQNLNLLQRLDKLSGQRLVTGFQLHALSYHVPKNNETFISLVDDRFAVDVFGSSKRRSQRYLSD